MDETTHKVREKETVIQADKHPHKHILQYSVSRHLCSHHTVLKYQHLTSSEEIIVKLT